MSDTEKGSKAGQKAGWMDRMFGAGDRTGELTAAERIAALDARESAPSAPAPSAPETAPAEPLAAKPLAADTAPVTAPPKAPTQVTDSPKPKDRADAPPKTQAPPPAPEASVVAESDKTEDWFTRMAAGLKRSTSKLSDGIAGIFTKRKLDDDTLEELEDLLVTADLGVSVAAKLAAKLADGRFDKEISGDEVRKVLATEIEAILTPVTKALTPNPANKPHVILMTGVNGAGKTTTIGKLAKHYSREGKKVMLAAGDTFRAAAVEQLKIWGDRVGVPVITKETGADAAALAYEAVERAEADGVDVLMIDTAGRLQNRDELMAELAKVTRVISKKLEGAPHDTVLVLDATTGQNAVHQVEVFSKVANITGLIMTKLDGSAKGGVLVACADKFGLPVHAIGVGEGIDDLRDFKAKDFAAALLGLM